jgi:serine/threonine protein kinase
MDEVEVLAKLDHPNIVNYHDCFMDEARALRGFIGFF